MAEVQERRHLCKKCGMSFSTGRVLGGHMKGHHARTAREKKLEARGGDAADEEEELGHVLTDIPKKSRNCGNAVAGSVVSPTPDPRIDFECKICRKGFASIKGLFGHMRLHPRKEKEEAKKKKKMKTVLVESDHGEEQHRSSDVYHCPVRGKRSIRVHYDAVSDSETEETVNEVAFSLVLLSRGVRNSEGYDSSTAAASAKRGIEVVEEEEEESAEISDCDDDGKNAESAESSSSSKNERKQKRAKKIDESCSGGAEDGSSSYKKHKCGICSKEFMSARALGGHKRSHTMKKSKLILQEAAAAASKNVDDM